jgi:hypothetical protein
LDGWRPIQQKVLGTQTGDVAQVVEHFSPSMKLLSSNTSAIKKKKLLKTLSQPIKN